MTSTATEAPVFDMLTLDDLYELHRGLCRQAADLHATLMSGQVALISPLSDEWQLKSARLSEITETADAAYAEVVRRELDEYPLTGVPMVCTACRKPVRACPNKTCAGHWKHELSGDSRGCAASLSGTVKAMVAEGNENVPRSDA
jgi:NAD-dependent dihydropyrimidine dehydrogenase PreA subunit